MSVYSHKKIYLITSSGIWRNMELCYQIAHLRKFLNDFQVKIKVRVGFPEQSFRFRTVHIKILDTTSFIILLSLLLHRSREIRPSHCLKKSFENKIAI